MFDLTDLVPLTVQTRDPNNGNVLTNATSVTLTISYVDATGAYVAVHPTVSNTSVGQYQVDYAPTQAGRHTVQWVATGVMTSGYSDIFDVRPATPQYLVSLTDIKQYLNILTATNDEELRGFVEAATDMVEDIVGPVIVRTVTETHSRPGRVLVLQQPPVISLVSVSSVFTGGWGYDIGTVDVDPQTGILRRLDGLSVGNSRSYPLRVIYRAGRPVVPASITLATKVIIDHLWETQRGHTQGIRPSPGTGRSSKKTSIVSSIPPRAQELLRPYRRPPVIF